MMPNHSLAMVVDKLKYVRRVVLLTFRNFLEDDCLNSSAALTYTTLFAIVPLLTVLYSILALFPTFQGTGSDIQQFIFSSFVPSAGETVSEWLTSFSNQARNLTYVGLGFLVVTALMMLRTVDGAINMIFHANSSRRPVASLLLYWVILTLGPILLGIGFAMTSYLMTLQFLDDATNLLGVQGLLLRVLPVFMSAFTFTLLYLVVPKRKVHFSHALIGGFFVAFATTLSRLGFTLFLKISPTYEFIYGAFAAVPVFLIWVFLSWIIVLMGAELVHALGEPRNMECQDFSLMLSMVAILATFCERFEQGLPTDLEHVQKAGWPVSQRHWEQVTGWLMGNGLVGEHASRALVPARPFSVVQLSDVIRQCPWPLPKEHELQGLKAMTFPTWFTDLVAEFEGLNSVRDGRLAGSLEVRLQNQK